MESCIGNIVERARNVRIDKPFTTVENVWTYLACVHGDVLQSLASHEQIVAEYHTFAFSDKGFQIGTVLENDASDETIRGRKGDAYDVGVAPERPVIELFHIIGLGAAERRETGFLRRGVVINLVGQRHFRLCAIAKPQFEGSFVTVEVKQIEAHVEGFFLIVIDGSAYAGVDACQKQ